ncbi:MAG: hypothetical protein ACLFV4_09305 [Candidatus Hydrogenedentota bacterium]
MKIVAGLAAAAVLLMGALSAAAQPEPETPSSPFVLASERNDDSPLFAGTNTPIVRLLADTREAEARDDRPDWDDPPESRRDSERGEDERGSRRPPREAREAMQRVRIHRLAETLDLDEQETGKVVQRIEAHEEEYRELQRELGEARHELRRALREDEDEDTVSEMLDKALELEGKKILHQRDGYREITEDFDAKQQARFYLFMPEFEEDMRRLVERARDLRRMPPAFHEKLEKMDPKERREFFREHDLFPGRRDEGEAAPDERRRDRPEAGREEREEQSRGRREGIGEEEREVVRERLERMVEDLDDVEAEQGRERLERLFEFVGEEVPEVWRESIRKLRERWEERRDVNSEKAEDSARKDDVWEERLPWMRDRGSETVRRLREHSPEMPRSEWRERFEDRVERLDDVSEEDVERLVERARELPHMSIVFHEKLEEMDPKEQREFFREHGLFPGRQGEGEAGPDERRRERLERRGANSEKAEDAARKDDVWEKRLPWMGDRRMETVRELQEHWTEMSRSERRERFEDRFERLDEVSEEDMRRFVREGPDRRFPRVGVEVRAQDAPRLREKDMERLRELRDKWADMSRSERRERFEECFERLNEVSEKDVRRFMREGPDRRFP